MKSGSRHYTPLAILLLGALAYVRGLFGGFLFDDYPNIVSNTLLQTVDGSLFHWMIAALSSGAGLLRRPVSMLSFALNFYWFGMSPLAFKIVNLAIHLLNGWLVYRLGLRLVPQLVSRNEDPDRARGIALFAAGLWLLHPLNVSGVMYVVQRMNELSASFTLAGLLCYAEGRLRMSQGRPGLFLCCGGILAFGTLATFSKENGVLITAYALVIEAIGFRFAAPAQARGVLGGFFILTVLAPCLAFAIYLGLHPGWLQHGYAERTFTLEQRLLTEPRVLFHYLLWIFVPWPAWMSLYHDDIPAATDWLHPLGTLPAILAWLVLMALAVALRRRQTAFTFAVAWFLVGHSMESTVLPLELVFEHRNYLPMYGPLLGATVLAAPAVSQRLGRRRAMAAAAFALLALSTLTALRAYTWGDNFRLAFVTAADHPDSPRALYDAGRTLIQEAEAEGRPVKAAQIEARADFQRAAALDPLSVFSSAALVLSYSDEPQVPPAAIEDLRFRFEHTGIFQIAVFSSVLRAATDGKLALSPTDIESLVKAALDNPSTGNSMRAQILNDYGRYQFVRRNDAQQAVTLTLAAVAQDPSNPLFRINLAKLALALNRVDKAQEAIEAAQRLDHADLYRKDIAGIMTQIAAARTPH